MRLIQALSSGWNTGTAERSTAIDIKGKADWNWSGGPCGSGPNIPQDVTRNASFMHPMASALGKVREVYSQVLNQPEDDDSSVLAMFAPSALWPTTSRHCAAVAYLLGSEKKKI